MTEPLGLGRQGQPVHLGDIWPSSDEVYWLMKLAMDPKAFRKNCARVRSKPGKSWDGIPGV